MVRLNQSQAIKLSKLSYRGGVYVEMHLEPIETAHDISKTQYIRHEAASEAISPRGTMGGRLL